MMPAALSRPARAASGDRPPAIQSRRFEKREMSDRISLADDGTLDEIVAGQAHLECLDDNHWFLSMTRKDGSEVCVRLHARGRITASWEEREPRPSPAAVEMKDQAND